MAYVMQGRLGMKAMALYDRNEKIATLSGSVEEMTAQAAKAIAAVGHARPESIRVAVGHMAECGDVRLFDIPSVSESGRCWSRWYVAKV